MSWASAETPCTKPPEEESARRPARPSSQSEVLVVNQDPEVRLLLQRALVVGNFSSTSVTSRSEAVTCLRKGDYAAVVISIESPEAMDTAAGLRAEFPDVVLIAFSRAATPDLVRDVMKLGVDDFVFGTFDARSLSRRVREVVAARRDVAREPDAAAAVPEDAESSCDEPSAEPARVARHEPPTRIISKNARMARVIEIATKIAVTDSTVLVQGESGTGKELIARWVHHRSNRGTKPFVELNCGALPENLLESQLFGHEKGSFTGAVHRQLGLFEVADGGTIFLDEIGEMGLDMQVKLLRVLQSREFRRIGGSSVVKVDVRVIAATNRDLKEEVEAGRFRRDLFYRLNVICLELPPLRERVEEIPDLVAHFSERLASERGLPRKTFLPEAVQMLQGFSWEGNIRELENSIERLMLLTQTDTITVKEIEEHLGSQKRQLAADSPFLTSLSLDEVKRLHIARVLKENRGNKMRSARILQINVKTLYNLIRSLNITY